MIEKENFADPASKGAMVLARTPDCSEGYRIDARPGCLDFLIETGLNNSKWSSYSLDLTSIAYRFIFTLQSRVRTFELH